MATLSQQPDVTNVRSDNGNSDLGKPKVDGHELAQLPVRR